MDQQRETKANGGESDGAAVEKVGSPPAQDQQGTQPSGKKRKDVNERIADYTLWLMVGTGVLAVSTVALAGVTAGLWRYAAEQAHDMKNSIKASIEANEIAREALSSDRAWMGISDFTAGPLVDGQDFSAVITFNNFGRSAAVNCRTKAQGQISRKDGVIASNRDTNANLGAVTCLPGQGNRSELRFSKSDLAGHVDKIKSGEEEFIIIASAYYDTSGLIGRSSKIKLVYHTGIERFIYAQEGNSAD